MRYWAHGAERLTLEYQGLGFRVMFHFLFHCSFLKPPEALNPKTRAAFQDEDWFGGWEAEDEGSFGFRVQWVVLQESGKGT